MHNHRSLFNMVISGGLPTVLIQMLVASSPGRIRLLPALPEAWPVGTIEGALCRGQIEIRQLSWEPGRIRVTLLSARVQSIKLSAPSAIKEITGNSGEARIAAADEDRTLEVTLPRGQAVTLDILLDASRLCPAL
jgi:hypothetical protein